MASSGKKLQVKFGTPAGPKTWTINYIKNNVSQSDVRTFANAMISNGEIFQNTPLTAISAEIVQTSVTQIDIS